MGPKVRKLLVTGLVWSFAMAIYQTWFQPMWNDWLAGTGHTVGVAETALGFFLAWFIAMMFGWWVSRSIGGQKA